MPQLSLYLDDSTMDLLKEEAKRTGQSLSKYAAQSIRAGKRAQGWPDGFMDLYGCLDSSFKRPDQGDASLDNDPASFFEEA